MNDQAFLHMLVERANLVVALEKKGRKRKAATERSAIYRDIDFYCRHNPYYIPMYEKLMLYYLEERPALAIAPRRRNSKKQKRKERNEWSSKFRGVE